jgi:hypothetical protein
VPSCNPRLGRFDSSAAPLRLATPYDRGVTDVFTAETFSPRIGERFHVTLENGQKLDLELVEVTASSARGAGLRPPFSILFTGALEPLLPQKTYSFQHEELGSFDLFIVPIGQDEAGTQYEAVFG